MTKYKIITYLSLCAIFGCDGAAADSSPAKRISPFVDASYSNNVAERIQSWMTLGLPGQAEVIVEEIERSPCWLTVWGDEVELSAGIVKIYQNLCAFDDKTIEAGVLKYWKEIRGEKNKDGREGGEQSERDAKLFLFLRVVYDVPDSYPLKAMTDKEQNAQGVFIFFRKPKGQISLLGPLKVDDKGAVKLSVQPDSFTGDGYYNGPDDYKFLSTHFSRRAKPSEKK